MKLIISLLFCSIFFLALPAEAKMLITYRAPEHEGDMRYEYDNALLKLALDKTIEEYGPYELRPSPIMNYARAIKFAETNALPNLILKLSFEQRFLEKMTYAPIPLDRGIVGYRVFFLSKDNKEKVANIKTIDELKELTLVQGRGWGDIPLLENAGFKVDVLPTYENIFPYVAKGRADLFPRGANELLGEYEAYKNIENLAYDETKILYYPLPRFFFTTKENTEVIERITLGLKKAWKDGSFVALWEEKYRENINFLNMKERQIFKIENPEVEILNGSYLPYMYNPIEE